MIHIIIQGDPSKSPLRGKVHEDSQVQAKAYLIKW